MHLPLLRLSWERRVSTRETRQGRRRIQDQWYLEVSAGSDKGRTPDNQEEAVRCRPCSHNICCLLLLACDWAQQVKAARFVPDHRHELLKRSERNIKHTELTITFSSSNTEAQSIIVSWTTFVAPPDCTWSVSRSKTSSWDEETS